MQDLPLSILIVRLRFPLLLSPTREAIRALYESNSASQRPAGGFQSLVRNLVSQGWFVGVFVHDGYLLRIALSF
jgi:hypothetical protein